MKNPDRRILVVEDDALTRKMLRITLETAGYEVIEAADGRGALVGAAEHMPALVLQDLILPDMNGFELVRQLRALPRPREMYIFALSGFLTRVEEAAEAGFTAILAKPVEPSRLLDMIAPYFPARTNEPLEAGRGRRVLVVDDDPAQLELIRVHLEQLGFEVASAHTRAEALHLARVHPPDILLSDVLMPELDGYELCMELRRDFKLQRIPVVLFSACSSTEADRDLARRVGASALVPWTPDLDGVGKAILDALRLGAPALNEKTSAELEHAKAVSRQLERQVETSTELTRRCSLQAAQLALLSGVADALTQRTDTDAALRDVLAATLDATGISKGAIFLRDGSGAMILRHAIGFLVAEREGLASFFGEMRVLESAVDDQATVTVAPTALSEALSSSILGRAGVASAEMVPLVSQGHSIGAIFLAAKNTDRTNEDAIAFVRAMGNQLAQSLELATSLARLAASEQRYRTVIESANDAISILTHDGVVLEANRSLEQALGLPRDQIIGKRMCDLSSPDEPTASRVGNNGRSTAGQMSRRSITRPDGSVVQMEFSDNEVEVGGAKLLFSIGRDVTDQVRTQAQLMMSDRLASVGMLAAGVAHEINNPLAAVLGNLECAAADLSVAAGKERPQTELDNLTEEIGEATNAAIRMRQIVDDLRLFSRAADEKSEPVDVRKVMDSALRIAWNEIRHRAGLVKDYEDTPPVLANESRLGQVFLNLVVNAAQAMPEGTSDKNTLRVRTSFHRPTSRVTVEVSDTGCGMPPEAQRRIFTPFFTTKPLGVGTGLGLAICQRIVTSFGGEIEFESEVGKGTLCRVLLQPASMESPRQAQSRADAGVRRRGRILVVDDERMIIAVVKRVLSDHDVVGVTDATDALARLERGEHYDVILCDLMMPVVTGIDFLRRLEERGDDHCRRVVFLTGGVVSPVASQFFERISNQHIDKPFEGAMLRKIITERLN